MPLDSDNVFVLRFLIAYLRSTFDSLGSYTLELMEKFVFTRTKTKEGKKVITLEIPEFQTHVQMTKTKYRKVNGQSLYVGMNHFMRAKIMSQLHTYLSQFIDDKWVLAPPVEIRLEFHVPINYGTVKLMKDKNLGYHTLRWKAPPEGYAPNWDADNQWIWTKAFNDTLVKQGVIPDDSVQYIKASGEVRFVEVETIQERKLVFVISEI